MIIAEAVCDNCGKEAGIRAERGTSAYAATWKTATKMGWHKRRYTEVCPVKEGPYSAYYIEWYKTAFGREPGYEPVTLDHDVDLCPDCDELLMKKGV